MSTVLEQANEVQDQKLKALVIGELLNENGTITFIECVKNFGFDYNNVKEDVNGNVDESFLKAEIPDTLFEILRDRTNDFIKNIPPRLIEINFSPSRVKETYVKPTIPPPNAMTVKQIKKALIKSVLDEISAHYQRNHVQTPINLESNVRKKLWKIKTRTQYKKMKEMRLKLEDSEIICIILYTDYNIFAQQLRKTHREKHVNTCHWQYLFDGLKSGLTKINKVFHCKNSDFYREYVEDEQKELLFRGVGGVSFDEKNNEKLACHTITSFSESFKVAKKFFEDNSFVSTSKTGIIWVIPNAFHMIYLEMLLAADVSWISRHAEKEWIVLPITYDSVDRIENNNERYCEYMREINTKQVALYEVGIARYGFYSDIKRVRKQISKECTNEVGELFEKIVFKFEQFDEMEKVKEDLADTNSFIFKKIESQLNEDGNTEEEIRNIKIKIQAIVLNKIISHAKDTFQDVHEEIIKHFAPNIADILSKELNEIANDEGFVECELKDILYDNNAIIERLDCIVADVSEISDSALLCCLDKIPETDEKSNICENAVMLQQIITRAVKLKKRTLSPNSYNILNIRSLIINVTKTDVQETSEVLSEHCPKFYEHLPGIAKKLKASHLYNIDFIVTEHKQNTNMSRGRQTQSTEIENISVSIAKAIDFLNGKTVMFWLFNLYLKERSRKYREGEIPIKKGYTPGEWWSKDSSFGKYVSKKYRRMAAHMEACLTDFITRLLPPINGNYLIFPTVCDILSDFTEYAVAFQEIAISLSSKAPVQIDTWIIPQMTKSRPKPKSAEPFDQKELSNRRKSHNKQMNEETEETEESDPIPFPLDVGDIEEILTDPKLGYIKGKDFFVMERNMNRVNVAIVKIEIDRMIQKYKAMQQKKGLTDCRNRFIFIIDRRHPENVKNKTLENAVVYEKSHKTWSDRIFMIAPKEYSRENKERLCICGSKLKRELRSTKTLCDYCQRGREVQYKDVNIYETEMWTCSKCDPLHPNGYNLCCQCTKVSISLCVCGLKLLIKSKTDIPNGINNVCKWCNGSIHHSKSDNVWLCCCGYCLCSVECVRARPETFGTLSRKYEEIPESCLALSKSYILLDHKNDEKVPITMSDALNGYMFGLSYHILNKDNISAYWYHGGGGTYFQISDIQKGWPQRFEKINRTQQTLTGEQIEKITDKEMRLSNVYLEEFERQCKDKFTF